MITLIRKYASHGDIIYMTIFYGLFFFFAPTNFWASYARATELGA